MHSDAHGCMPRTSTNELFRFRYAEELELLKPTTEETADTRLDDAFCYAPFRVRDALSQPTSKYRNWTDDRAFVSFSLLLSKFAISIS
jgi:hypothetical protein